MYSDRKRIAVTGGSGFIGVHLIEQLIPKNYEILNLDIKPPVNGKNLDLWRNISVTDKILLQSELYEFDPHFIVHLAATTTQNAKSLDEFKVNIIGSENLFEIANKLSSLSKLIFTSTQYVNSPGCEFSTNAQNLQPYGFYGKSKLIGEEMVNSILQIDSWIIIRPTTIWGPWHPILTNGLWKQIILGRYFHPRNDQAIKAYGYVKNSAWQIVQLLEKENAFTDGKVFYIGDENIYQSDWVESFVRKIHNRDLRKISKYILFIASEIGEILKFVGINFPLYRSRYRNLMTSNPSPLNDTIDLLGASPISFESAVDETVSWLMHSNYKSNRVDK